MEALLPWIAPVVGLFILVPIALLALPSARAKERESGKADRLRLIASGAEIIAVLALVRLIGTWTQVTILGWYAVVAVAAIALAGLVVRAASLPWTAPTSSARAWIPLTAASVAVSAAVVVIPPLL